MNTTLRENFTLVSLLVALAVGLCVALLTWLFSQALATVPEEDRAYKDPPPLGFRVLWWPIQWISHFINPLVGAKVRAKGLVQLRKAGLDYSLSAVQFLASRILCAACMAALAWWLLDAFESVRSSKAPGLNPNLYWGVMATGAFFGWLYPLIWLKDRLGARKRELLKALPFFLDIITLCVEAGLNMQGAMLQAVTKGPKGALRDEFQRVLRDIRAGKGRAVALRAMADRLGEPSVTNFTTAVIQAEIMGMNLGPVLRAQADQRRSERFLRAEKLAMQAPVKMLLPLIAFIFPCTFIVLFFPIAMKFMHGGF